MTLLELMTTGGQLSGQKAANIDDGVQAVSIESLEFALAVDLVPTEGLSEPAQLIPAQPPALGHATTSPQVEIEPAEIEIPDQSLGHISPLVIASNGSVARSPDPIRLSAVEEPKLTQREEGPSEQSNLRDDGPERIVPMKGRPTTPSTQNADTDASIPDTSKLHRRRLEADVKSEGSIRHERSTAPAPEHAATRPQKSVTNGPVLVSHTPLNTGVPEEPPTLAKRQQLVKEVINTDHSQKDLAAPKQPILGERTPDHIGVTKTAAVPPFNALKREPDTILTSSKTEVPSAAPSTMPRVSQSAINPQATALPQQIPQSNEQIEMPSPTSPQVEASGERILRGDITTVVGTPQSISIPATAPTQLPNAAPVQQVLAQVAVLEDKASNGVIEVRLDPEELGKVRIHFVAREAGMVVSVFAERPETLDLLRRHSDELQSGLSDMDFEGADLEFSDDRPTDDAQLEDEIGIDTDQPVIPLRVILPALPAAQSDRLDIRL